MIKLRIPKWLFTIFCDIDAETTCQVARSQTCKRYKVVWVLGFWRYTLGGGSFCRHGSTSRQSRKFRIGVKLASRVSTFNKTEVEP